jgi:hypothetical protein
MSYGAANYGHDGLDSPGEKNEAAMTRSRWLLREIQFETSVFQGSVLDSKFGRLGAYAPGPKWPKTEGYDQCRS